MWQNIACFLAGLIVGQLATVIIISFMMGANDKED